MLPESITVHLIGDSTMARKSANERPETGWGTPFSRRFDASVTVTNHARNGRSTRTFLEEGRWEPVVRRLAETHYVFIQFGHNDEVPSKEQHTTEERFVANLEKFAEEARGNGAQTVLLTPIARRHFDEEGAPTDTHRVYSELVRDVSRARDVPLIDADERSRSLLRELGPTESKALYNHLPPGDHPNYPEGVADDTHFSEYGARRMAELVLDGIEELDLELAAYIRQDDR
ncbi:rhamnogalacturonan acetylesterase [Natrinema sp. 74]|uniref:rhamnogalacturonan acetylesterase n=1 Tax=Natrinema sp. 74 TaxID=3384159 RepID=UPI0038D3C10D